ncbi:hypothetical protein CRBSH125_26860 [Afipia carboxidovorans]|nr:hypothetical protein CRBSH125_26860 [Afipia carboxidovorans]
MLKRLAYRAAADAELRGEIVRDQPLSRHDAPGQDRLTHALYNVIDDLAAACARRAAEAGRTGPAGFINYVNARRHLTLARASKSHMAIDFQNAENIV